MDHTSLLASRVPTLRYHLVIRGQKEMYLVCFSRIVVGPFQFFKEALPSALP